MTFKKYISSEGLFTVTVVNLNEIKLDAEHTATAVCKTMFRAPKLSSKFSSGYSSRSR